MPWQQKEVPEVGVACLVFLIHTEMDAIFQPIKKSDTYQIKLLLDIRKTCVNDHTLNMLYSIYTFTMW